MSRWEWAQHGDEVMLHDLPGSVYRLTAENGHAAVIVDLPVVAVRELLEHLVGCEGYERLEQLEHALGVVEAERDEARERAATLEQQLAEAVATLETHRTAIDLADQRQRALEAQLEEWEQPADARRAEHRIAKSVAARVVREVTS